MIRIVRFSSGLQAQHPHQASAPQQVPTPLPQPPRVAARQPQPQQVPAPQPQPQQGVATQQPREQATAPPLQQGVSSARKRTAAGAFTDEVASKIFQQCWDAASVQKHGRFACTSDFLKVVNTKKACKFTPHLAERLSVWAKWDKYRWDESAYKQIAQFRKQGRGGVLPYGSNRIATKDIYNAVSGRHPLC